MDDFSYITYKTQYDAEIEKHCKKQEKLIKRLKRTLKPKFWQALESLKGDIWVGDFNIVKFDNIKGNKESGHAFFGESAPFRHVYADISYNTYSDSGDGDVYLPIGKARYLKVSIYC